ncbi:MAG: ABC transporter permease [Nitrospinae bacterium]|nr:ABC transporter permease [Nitrospinota bacterium]
MRIARVYAIAKKEIIQIRRDPLSMAMAFLLPLILLFIFGFAITMDIKNLKTVVCDLDKSEVSRRFASDLSASGYFIIVDPSVDYQQIERIIDSGAAKIAIAIPRGFSENIRLGKPAQIQALIDGSDANTATIAAGYLSAASDMFSAKLSPRRSAPAVDPRVRVWYNEDLKSRNFIIPGLIAVIMSVIAALLTSLTIAREWERGTMEQLITTPLKTSELIIGKLIPYFLIGFIDMLVAVSVTVFVFGVELKGSLVLLLVVSAVFLFGVLSLGILVSIMTKSQLPASQIALVMTFLPAFLLSGFMISIINMPYVLQLITRIVPARYFVTIIKGIFLKGSGLSLVWFDLTLLALFGAVVFAAANMKLKKKIA